MSGHAESRIQTSRGKLLKRCPWCGGPLMLDPQYPVMRLVPGHSKLSEDDLPPSLRTVAAFVCQTAFCKYREKA